MSMPIDSFLRGPLTSRLTRQARDTDGKYIFLLAFVSLLGFLHQFLCLLQFGIHQLLLQFSVFKYFVQMLRKNKVYISSLTYY